MLEDETFKFNSKAAMEARQAAVSLLEWAKIQDNQSSIKQFWQQIQKEFEESLKFLTSGSVNRDRLWRSFFTLRSSDKFIKGWKDFLSTAKVKPTPTLYQQLTSLMFNEEIQKKVKRESSSINVIQPLSDEGNALRYTTGYICRHLRKQWNVTTMN